MLHDLSRDYLIFIVGSTYDSDLRRVKNFYSAMLCMRSTSHWACVCACVSLSQVGVLLKRLNRQVEIHRKGPAKTPGGIFGEKCKNHLFYTIWVC